MFKMIDKANDLARKHRCSGVILMGDFNARHFIWNDTKVNHYGRLIESGIDWTTFGVLAPSCPTFLATNGSSLIDFFITSNNLDNHIGNTRVDYEVQLFI